MIVNLVLRSFHAHAHQLSKSPPSGFGAEALSITASAARACPKASRWSIRSTHSRAMRPQAIVMRHSASGAPHFLARHLPIPIVNAGDGTHEHPTQALLDARTILDQPPDARRVCASRSSAISRIAAWRARTCICYRQVRSRKSCSAARLRCCRASWPSWHPACCFDQRYPRRRSQDADVVMMLRVQLERQHEVPMSAGEYFQLLWPCGWSTWRWRNRTRS